MTYFDQWEYEVRCEWGPAGLAELLPGSDAIIIVDVLSFSTCVDIAAANGAIVYPYRDKDESAAAFASSMGAALAAFARTTERYSLAPSSLVRVPTGTRLVLPSPNGSALSVSTGNVPTYAGCLRNAHAVARAAQRTGARISVIPAGERWHDGSLRPALEDLVGAGAIIHHLTGPRSPEAELAVRAYLSFERDLPSGLARCSSGRELIGRGFPEDVRLAAALNVSDCAPVLVGGAYARHGG